MNILISTDNNYIAHAATLLVSLFENNKNEDAQVYVMVDKAFLVEYRTILISIASRFNKELTFIELNQSEFDLFPIGRDNLPVSAYYRLLCSELLPTSIDKILYLDCDIVILGAIRALYEEPIDNVALGAVLDWTGTRIFHYNRLRYEPQKLYFNSGVLLINLKYWREQKAVNKFQDFVSKHSDRIIYSDQDVLNYVFRDSKRLLPLKYNSQTGFFIKNPEIPWTMEDELYEAINNPLVIHYCTSSKPWIKGCEDIPYRNEYFRYRKETPFADYPLQKKVLSRKDRLKELAQLIGLLPGYTSPFTPPPQLTDIHVIVSVIIPVYNVENYLVDCLCSVLRQLYTQYEILLINDGSTDGSGTICKCFSELDSRIRYFEKPNGGQASARNLGLDNANGKYITFVDSDDVLLDTGTYSTAIKYLEEHKDVDIVQFPYYKINKDGEKFLSSYGGKADIILKTKKEYFENVEVVTDYCHQKRMLSSGQCDKVFRREIFDGLRYGEGHVFEDTLLSCYIFERAKAIALIGEGAYGYYVRENSTTTSKRSLKKYKDQLNSQIYILKHLIENNGDKHMCEITTKALLKFCAGVYASTSITADLATQVSLLQSVSERYIKGLYRVSIKLNALQLVMKMQALFHRLKSL